MAATAAHTKVVRLKSATGSTSGSDNIAGCDSCEVSESRTVLEITAYADAEFRKRIMGLRDATISVSGTLDLSDSPQSLIRSLYASGADAFLTVLFDGTNGYEFPCKIASYNCSGAVDEANTFSAEFQLTGAPVARP